MLFATSSYLFLLIQRPLFLPKVVAKNGVCGFHEHVLGNDVHQPCEVPQPGRVAVAFRVGILQLDSGDLLGLGALVAVLAVASVSLSFPRWSVVVPLLDPSFRFVERWGRTASILLVQSLVCPSSSSPRVRKNKSRSPQLQLVPFWIECLSLSSSSVAHWPKLRSPKPMSGGCGAAP